MIDPELRRVLQTALQNEGELYVLGDGAPDDQFAGIVRASNAGYLKHLPGSGIDEIQFWRLTDKGYIAMGIAPPVSRWSKIAAIARRFGLLAK